MMDLYGAAVARERSRWHEDGTLARFVRWEYGEGTGVGFLEVQAVTGGGTRKGPRMGIFGRLAGRSRARDARAIPTGWDGVEVEMTLVAQWKQGAIRTQELVERLEELRQRDPIRGACVSP